MISTKTGDKVKLTNPLRGYANNVEVGTEGVIIDVDEAQSAPYECTFKERGSSTFRGFFYEEELTPLT